MKDMFTIETKDDVTHVSTFICRHGDEHMSEAEALKAEAYEELGKKYTVSDGNFLSVVVIELNWEYSAAITDIFNDQWSMVCAETLDKKFQVTVQCDYVEDGTVLSFTTSEWDAFLGGVRRHEFDTARRSS